jgi:small subunit ribosomal protein S2
MTLIKEMMDAGAHFGHQSHKWNPKMRTFIFDKRNGIHIINLEITVNQLLQACAFVTDLTSRGKKVLFVGTKSQAKEKIVETARELEMPYVAERWLGGMLTNLKTIRQSINKLEKFQKMEEDGSLAELSKKEQSRILKEKAKLEKNLTGVQSMKSSLPEAMFVVDPGKENIAVHEANKLGIPIIAILDTNCNPDCVDYCIPANDDSIRTVRYILEKIRDAALSGRKTWIKNEEIRKAREAEERAAEQARLEEQRRKAEEAKKQKEEAEKEQKAKADAIIADLEQSEKKK